MAGHSRVYRPRFWARFFLPVSWQLALSGKESDRIRLKLDREYEIACDDISDVTLRRALLWHTVNIRSKNRNDELAGLSAETAQALAGDLLAFVNQHLTEQVTADIGQLNLIDEKIRAITDDQRQYLAHADVSRAIASVPGPVAAALSHPLFDHNHLPQNARLQLPASFSMLTDPNARHLYNESFVPLELKRYAEFFDNLGEHSLSSDQREACIRLEDNNLLIASAGSGKSATMVGKVAYALEKKLYAPNEILVLAFNRSATEELKQRIARQLGVEQKDLQCQVKTFHSLGRDIIRTVEGRPPQLANWVAHPAGETRIIDQIISELIATDPSFAGNWASLLTYLQKADIPAEVFGTEEDYQRYITEARTKGGGSIGSLAGCYVKSLQEQRIVNWLWLNSVEFEYEKQVAVPEDADAAGPAGDEGATRREPELIYFHPDFYYPGTDTYHEHFALNADGSSPFENYAVHAKNKRDGYSRAGFDFFETTSGQASAGVLIERLEAELQKRAVTFRQRSFSEIKEAVAPVVIQRYHKLISVSIKHIRASKLSLEMLLKRAETLHDKLRARCFAEAVWAITNAYSRKLEEAERIDFDSMIGDAAKLVETGSYQSPYSLILIDEFQDISEPRANLIKALKYQKPFTKLFAVGDDWQSIYRFAGSDVTIFTQFEANFGTSWQGKLEHTYRCNQMLADTAASFVQRNPAQFKKAVRSARPAIRKSIRAIPIKVAPRAHSFSEPCHQLLRRLDKFLEDIAPQWRQAAGDKLKVLILWRYNRLDPFWGGMSEFRNIVVSGRSFHRSKGLEADYTILLDVSEDDYGVPSRVEDDELLNLVIPRPEQFPYAEERRLFYVALTRASRGVFILYNRAQPSRYIRELYDISGDDVRFEAVDGSEIHVCRSCLVGEMVERPGRDKKPFLGCSQFPNCKHTEPCRSLPSAPSLEGAAKLVPAGLAGPRICLTSGLNQATNWSELQAHLRMFDMELYPRGGGLALRSYKNGNIICKLSELGFSYSTLIQSFGEGFPGHGHRWIAERALAQSKDR